MPANFDLSNLALQSVCPNNELLYDDKGLPSVMVKIPKMTYAQLGISDSTAVHPAFIVNGQEVDAIYISKYQNVVVDGRAYSLPGRDPQAAVAFDTARGYCEAKGAGWHIMTRAEWALIALWCLKNDSLPYGNNDYGKDYHETSYKAVPSMARDSSNRIQRVATGTGPLKWSHDGTPSGIWDLNGNVWEWVGGLRTVYGEVQVLANNNAADKSHSQSASSSEWKAIDATTGEFVTPDGSGTTANSIKMDYISSKLTFSTAITAKSDTTRSVIFGNVICDATISDTAKNVLYALGLLPKEIASKYEEDYFYFNNGASERSFYCGGYWSNTSTAGVFALGGYDARSTSVSRIGFRSAFVELPI